MILSRYCPYKLPLEQTKQDKDLNNLAKVVSVAIVENIAFRKLIKNEDTDPQTTWVTFPGQLQFKIKISTTDVNETCFP